MLCVVLRNAAGFGKGCCYGMASQGVISGINALCGAEVHDSFESQKGLHRASYHSQCRFDLRVKEEKLHPLRDLAWERNAFGAGWEV